MNKLDLTDSQVIKLKKLLESLFDLSKKEDDFEPEIEEIYIKLAKVKKED